MATRKKNGAPDSKHYEAPDTIAKFEPVKQWLVKNCRKVGAGERRVEVEVEWAGRKKGEMRRLKAVPFRRVNLFNAHHNIGHFSWAHTLYSSLHAVHAGRPAQQQEPGHAGVCDAAVPRGV